VIITDFLIFFLAMSVLFYVLFAGADFGAGILEVFMSAEGKVSKESRDLVSRAMAPVWEANHVWLVLAVVIVFVAFPQLYLDLSTYLHLPMMAVLVGIVARGSAFTFRYYDTVDARYTKIYTRVFSLSSVWTSVFLGVTVGAVILGRIHPAALSYSELYIEPWLNLFSFCLGIFTSALFAFLAAVYLVGESGEAALRASFLRKAAWANALMVISGALVFAAAEAESLGLLADFLHSPVALLSWALASILLVAFWRQARKQGRRPKRSSLLLRSLAAGMVFFVLLAWFAVQYPTAIRYSAASQLMSRSFAEIAAPAATQRQLLLALCVGSALILPALAYLLKIFKWESLKNR
jgi:cytochrome d ubiquinol oxidase subunit II